MRTSVENLRRGTDGPPAVAPRARKRAGTPRCCWPLFALLALVWTVFAVPRPLFEAVRDFVAPEFYPPPHHTQLRTLIRGALAEPAGPGVIRIKQVRVERFSEDGRRELLIEAPESFYHLEAQELTSAGPVTAQSGDNRYRLSGVGFRFVYRGADSVLLLSNQVQTTIVGLGHGPLKP